MAYKYQLGTAILSGALSPGANNSFGLGIDGAAWSDLHISGTAYIVNIGASGDPVDTLRLAGSGLYVGAGAGTQVTATGGQLNFVAGVTAGTALADKAMVLNSSKAITGVTSVTSTNFVGAIDGAIGGNTPATGDFLGVACSTLAASGLAQLDGGLDVDGAFTVSANGTAVSGFATISGSGNSQVGGNLTLGTTGQYGLTRAGAGTMLSLDVNDGNISNVGQLFCDVVEPADASEGLALVFGGVTTKNKLELTNSLADALNITEGVNSFLKFNTDSDTIIFGQDSTFTGTTIDHLGTVAAATSITTTALVGGTIAGSTISGSARASLSSLRLDGASIDATLALGADDMYFFDATDNLVKKQSWAAIATAMAGSGITAAAGVLSADAATTATDVGDASATITEGFNFSSANFGGPRTWTLPAAPTTGDVVTVKTPSNTSEFPLTVAADAAHTIDGNASILIDSDYGAVSFVCGSGSVSGIDWYIK